MIVFKFESGEQQRKSGSRSMGRWQMRSELDALKKRLYGGPLKAKNVKFFPGFLSDSTPEDMAREMNKFFADPAGEKEDELSED